MNALTNNTCKVVLRWRGVHINFIWFSLKVVDILIHILVIFSCYYSQFTFEIIGKTKKLLKVYQVYFTCTLQPILLKSSVTNTKGKIIFLNL